MDHAYYRDKKFGVFVCVFVRHLVVNVDVANAEILCTGDVSGVIVADATGGFEIYVHLVKWLWVYVNLRLRNDAGRFTNLGVGFYPSTLAE
jgi:hypothetical protein